MARLKPGTAIDAAEAKILKHRIETSLASPGILALLAMLALTAFCYLIGRSDWMAIICTLLLGGGVFLYSLARTIDRLVDIQKAMQASEMRLLGGAGDESFSISKSDDSRFWEITDISAGTTAYRLPVPANEASVVMVSGARLYNLWVERRLDSGGGMLQAGVPRLREEMKRSDKVMRGRERLATGTGSTPVLQLEENRGFKIIGGEEELMELIVSRTATFPIIAADEATAMTVRKHAGR